MPTIVPTILTANVGEVKEKLQQLSGLVDWLHLDIIDGKFVDCQTVKLQQLKDLNQLREFKLGGHLMVDQPAGLINQARGLGLARLVGQVESMASQPAFVRQVKEAGMKPGLALDLGTSIEQLDNQLLTELEIVLIMLVKAGRGGQRMARSRLEEVRRLVRLREESASRFKIGVDGGVNQQTITDCVQAGAEVLAVGSAIWRADEPGQAIKDLRRLANAD